ncbi:MAG: acyltransferase [Ignavibacteria bacterium]|nr:acyltransferase [Ignavibacteria bacterium]
MGIRRTLSRLHVLRNVLLFGLRKFLYGFETANLMTRYIGKESLAAVLIRNGAVIGTNSDIESGLTFHNCKDYSNLVIGDNTHIGKNCFFDLAGKIIIGKNVVISMNCTFITHLNIHKSALESIYSSSTKNIIINDDSYVGASVTMLMGVEIGRESVIAAGSLVKESFGDRILIAGNPAVFKKQIIK